MIPLKDNTTYIQEDLPVLQGKQTEGVKFLKRLSALTISELNEKEEENGGILVWPHSFKENKDGRDDLRDMKIVECVEREGKIETLRTGNLVGFVGNGKVQIEINSRFSKQGNKQTEQDYFLYYMLSRVFHMNVVNMEVDGGTLKELDLLIFMFPRLLQDAMRQGMYKQYVKREYNDSNVRGTIDVNRHMRFNNPPNGRIAYRTREFSFDNYVTQLIRHTIEHIERRPMGRALLSGSKEIEECVKHIIQSTSSYQKGLKRQVIADNRKVVSHPYFTKYKILQKLCLAILRNERISHGTQSDKVHGVLIDVAWLWEEYLAIVLSEVGFKHHANKDGFKLFANRENGKLFQKVIPDYLHKNNYVADAKYIPLHSFEHLDAERAAAVYYKTIMYMYRFATPKGFLFHPCHANDIEESETLKGEYDKERNIIKAHYEIPNGGACYLYKYGMIIPTTEGQFSDFTTQMSKVEQTYTSEISQLL